MIPTSELSKGALINSPTGLKNNSLTLSMVESWDEEFIILKGDRKVKRVECEGIELTDEWWGKFGFSDTGQRMIKFLPDGTYYGVSKEEYSLVHQHNRQDQRTIDLFDYHEKRPGPG